MPREIILGDKNSNIYKDFYCWLRQCNALFRECSVTFDYPPFDDHEQEAVSLLLGAAHRAGHMALAESKITRKKGYGRSDLWIRSNERDYYFEFKRTVINPHAKMWGLDHSLEIMRKQWGEAEMRKGDIAIGGIIARFDNLSYKYKEKYKSFSNEMDITAILHGKDGKGAYIFLKEMKVGRYVQ